jgi:hypothetical protein
MDFSEQFGEGPWGPGGGPPAEMMAAQLVVLAGVMTVAFAVQIVICVIVSRMYRRLPPAFRLMEPAMTWLLLIPCFNLFWNFIVFPRLSQSYCQALQAAEVTEYGKCHEDLAMAYCILCLVSLIPCCCVNYIAMLAALIVLILYLVQMSDLSRLLPEAGFAEDEFYAHDGYGPPADEGPGWEDRGL